MAPAFDGNDRRISLRWSRAIPPSWTTGDDSDDEVELDNQKRRWERRARRPMARQENPRATSTFGVAMQTAGLSSGTAPVRALRIPDFASATITDGVDATPAPSSGNGHFPRSSLPEPDSDESGPDSDSEDESSTLAPTSTYPEKGGPANHPLPTGTAIDPLPAWSTDSSPDADAAEDAAGTARHHGHDGRHHHGPMETALTVVGSVAGVVCVAVAMWLFYRFLKRRRDGPSTTSTPRPSRRARFLAHIPILRTRFANRPWYNIQDPIADEKDRQFMANINDDLLCYLPEKPPAAAAAAGPQTRYIHVNEAGYYTTTAMPPAADTRPAIPSADQIPLSPTETSLSSAFGNGTYMPPTELHPPPPERHPKEDLPYPPPPAATAVASHRDTVYTESSEASSAPRFRTVNSWVRHQKGYVQRVPSPPPVPEQGYGLMMPDEEEARRVVVAPEGVGYAK